MNPYVCDSLACLYDITTFDFITLTHNSHSLFNYKNKVNVNKLKLLILDEADEMLSVGFKDQVYQIFQHLPDTITVSLFSATLPKELEDLTNKFMRDPIKILVKNEMLTLEGISQYYIALETDNDKFNTIKDLFGWISSSQAIIYCNSLKRVSDLYSAMIKDEFPAVWSKSKKEDKLNEAKKEILDMLESEKVGFM